VNVRRSLAASVLVVAPLLSSCGFNAPTTQVYNPPVGVNNQSSMVDALNVLVVSDTDSTGTLVAGLANNDQLEDDRLADVRATGESQGVQVEVSGPTEIPAGELLDLSDVGGVTLQGTSLRPGSWVTLTFEFDNAASVTVDAPVLDYTADGPYQDVPVR